MTQTPAQNYLRHIVETSCGIDSELSRWLIYAHYDIDQTISEHVIYFLKQAAKAGFNIYFVTTVPELDATALAFLDRHVSRIIYAENSGRDLLSYRVGFTQLDLATVQEVLFANDTVVGPIGALEEFLDFAQRSSADVIGYSDSYEVRYHLQSYFFLLKHSALANASVQDFLATFSVQPSLLELIEVYEVGMQDVFEAEGLSTAAYISQFAELDFYFLENSKDGSCPSSQPTNPARDCWLELIQKGRFALLKYRWVRDALPIENQGWRWVAELQRAGYDPNLIIPYLRRTRGRYHKPKNSSVK